MHLSWPLVCWVLINNATLLNESLKQNIYHELDLNWWTSSQYCVHQYSYCVGYSVLISIKHRVLQLKQTNTCMFNLSNWAHWLQMIFFIYMYNDLNHFLVSKIQIAQAYKYILHPGVELQYRNKTLSSLPFPTCSYL